MRLQSGIFDMDGTLLDSMPKWRSLGPSILKDAGIEVSQEKLDAFKTMCDQKAITYLIEECGLDRTYDEIRADMKARMDHFYTHEVKAKPGVEKFLSLLKMEGVWMYVATATDKDLVRTALRTAGIEQYFRGIITSGEVGSSKHESAEIYEAAMRRLQSNKKDTVVFEDALYAIKTAKSAGFRVAGIYDVTSEHMQEEIKSLCDYYITSYEEMFDIQ